MSLNLNKLERARQAANGMTQARCPACAESGGDRKGEHLCIYPDGRFGCCVHPKDKEHRRRIFALAGDRTPRRFGVRVAGAAPTVLPARSIRGALAEFVGTLGTGESESVSTAETAGTLGTPKSKAVSSTPDSRGPLEFNLGTFGTLISQPRAYRKEEHIYMRDSPHTCKDWPGGVPSVPSGQEGEAAIQPPKDGGKVQRMPHFTPGGTLVIPFDAPERFHWWKPGGQSVATTVAEVRSWMETTRKDDYGNGV